MSFDDLKKKIKTMDVEARRDVVRALGENRDREAFEVLIEFLEEYKEIRADILWALGKIGDANWCNGISRNYDMAPAMEVHSLLVSFCGSPVSHTVPGAVFSPRTECGGFLQKTAPQTQTSREGKSTREG